MAHFRPVPFPLETIVSRPSPSRRARFVFTDVISTQKLGQAYCHQHMLNHCYVNQRRFPPSSSFGSQSWGKGVCVKSCICKLSNLPLCIVVIHMECHDSFFSVIDSLLKLRGTLQINERLNYKHILSVCISFCLLGKCNISRVLLTLKFMNFFLLFLSSLRCQY